MAIDDSARIASARRRAEALPEFSGGVVAMSEFRLMIVALPLVTILAILG